MPDRDKTFYLRPQADRALREWYGDYYTTLPVRQRAALAQDVAEIMVEEDLSHGSGYRDPSGVAVMMLDIRIFPAPLSSYASVLAPDPETWS